MSVLGRFFAFVNICIATMVGLLLLVSATAAGSGPVVLPSAKHSEAAAVLRPAPSVSAALNWAGYVAENGTYTHVSGTWTVPSVSANDHEADATWVGIGGTKSHDLIQVGTEAIAVEDGVAYQAWYELLPDAARPIPVAVQSGDSVTASVTEVSPGEWRISLRNNTTGKSWAATKHYVSSRSSAEWIEEVPSAIGERLYLDDFGVINFTDGSAMRDGNRVSIRESGARALSMLNAAGMTAAHPSVLSADGKGFSIVRNDSVRAAALSISEADGLPSVGTSASWQEVSLRRSAGHGEGWDSAYYIVIYGL